MTMKPEQKILDATCGGRSIWHPDNKDRADTLYIDRRREEDPAFHGQPGRTYTIEPDEVQDFRDLPYEDETFDLVVFDPPHIVRENGMKSITGFVTKKYGCLHGETWQYDLKEAFKELFRVLRPGGVLVFKFHNGSIPFNDVLDCAPHAPLFGTMAKKNKGMETRWFTFYKPRED